MIFWLCAKPGSGMSRGRLPKKEEEENQSEEAAPGSPRDQPERDALPAPLALTRASARGGITRLATIRVAPLRPSAGLRFPKCAGKAAENGGKGSRALFPGGREVAGGLLPGGFCRTRKRPPEPEAVGWM